MGSFSWLRADVSTDRANIAIRDNFACLIPKEFGGGKIIDNYRDYGDLYDEKTGKKYDMYELLAFWNKDMSYGDGTVKDYLKWDGEFPNLKSKDNYTNDNRSIGINIGCYDEDMQYLKYPLKLVSYNYGINNTYEECQFRSFSDPAQGFEKNSWLDICKMYEYSQVQPDFYKMLVYKKLILLNKQDLSKNSQETLNRINCFIKNCKISNNSIIDLDAKRKKSEDTIEIANLWKIVYYDDVKQQQFYDLQIEKNNDEITNIDKQINDITTEFKANNDSKVEKIKVGNSVFIPNMYGGDKIWEFPITAININKGDIDIVVREESHYKVSDVGECIYLDREEAQIKLDKINEQKYKKFPMLYEEENGNVEELER